MRGEESSARCSSNPFLCLSLAEELQVITGLRRASAQEVAGNNCKKKKSVSERTASDRM